jgi:hypothetical protein
MAVSFNLIDEPFLPVVRLDGRTKEVGLRTALRQAHDLRELRDDSPLVTAALHRLLLAVLHRVFGPEDEDAWARLRDRGRWDAEAIDAYLGHWREIARVTFWVLLLKLPLRAALAPDCFEHNATVALLPASALAVLATGWWAFGRRRGEEGAGRL